MRKGCFLTTVFAGTIIIGILFYVGEKHGDKIVDFFKGRVVEITSDSADEYFDKLAHTNYKDSLKVLWNDVNENAKAMDFEDGINYVSTILLKIERYANDSLLSAEEYSSIKTLIRNETNKKN